LKDQIVGAMAVRGGAAGIGTLAGAAMRALAVCLLVSLAAGSAAAETGAPSPVASVDGGADLPPDVATLLDLLSKPGVQDWLTARSAAATASPPPAPTPSEPRMGAMSDGLSSVRAYMLDLAAGLPTLPAQFARAGNILTLEIQRWGLALVAALVGGFVIFGLVLDGLVHRATAGYRRWMIGQPRTTPAGRAKGMIGRFGLGAMKLAAFVLGSAGLFLMFDWPPLLGKLVLDYVIVAIIVRAVLMLGRATLLPPHLGTRNAVEIRALPLSDAAAAHWYRWSGVIAGLFAVLHAAFGQLEILGFDERGRNVLLVPSGLVCLAAVLLAIWLRPGPESADAGFRHGLSTWAMTGSAVVLLGLAVSGQFILFWVLLAALLLPAAVILCRNAVRYVLRPPEEGSGASPVQPITLALIDRGIRILLVVGVAWAVLRATGGDVAMMGSDDDMRTGLIRSAFRALLIVLGADFCWSLIRALIVHRLDPGGVEAHAGPPSDHAAMSSQNARLRTLLPIVQNILFAAIFVLAVLMVLSTFGINIAPLIAGAGVFGVAIGFGAQTVVKDMISGIFYMLDDAFRIGEYIQSGSYKGTVESFSIRSVRLRHHRGPVFTVPFGELGAVQNMSRDWSKDKFLISVAYDSDLEKVRKLSKKVGEALMQDPEFGPLFIEPMKMKGVEQFGDYGISVAFAMILKPGGQVSVVRRKALAMLRATFTENGIEFASPTIQVAGQGGGETGPAAAAAAAISARAAAPDPAA
jgi:small-conductance mechanosensitive channel